MILLMGKGGVLVISRAQTILAVICGSMEESG